MENAFDQIGSLPTLWRELQCTHSLIGERGHALNKTFFIETIHHLRDIALMATESLAEERHRHGSIFDLLQDLRLAMTDSEIRKNFIQLALGESGCSLEELAHAETMVHT